MQTFAEVFYGLPEQYMSSTRRSGAQAMAGIQTSSASPAKRVWGWDPLLICSIPTAEISPFVQICPQSLAAAASPSPLLLQNYHQCLHVTVKIGTNSGIMTV